MPRFIWSKKLANFAGDWLEHGEEDGKMEDNGIYEEQFEVGEFEYEDPAETRREKEDRIYRLAQEARTRKEDLELDEITRRVGDRVSDIELEKEIREKRGEDVARAGRFVKGLPGEARRKKLETQAAFSSGAERLKAEHELSQIRRKGEELGLEGDPEFVRAQAYKQGHGRTYEEFIGKYPRGSEEETEASKRFYWDVIRPGAKKEEIEQTLLLERAAREQKKERRGQAKGLASGISRTFGLPGGAQLHPGTKGGAPAGTYVPTAMRSLTAPPTHMRELTSIKKPPISQTSQGLPPIAKIFGNGNLRTPQLPHMKITDIAFGSVGGGKRANQAWEREFGSEIAGSMQTITNEATTGGGRIVKGDIISTLLERGVALRDIQESIKNLKVLGVLQETRGKFGPELVVSGRV